MFTFIRDIFSFHLPPFFAHFRLFFAFLHYKWRETVFCIKKNYKVLPYTVRTSNIYEPYISFVQTVYPLYESRQRDGKQKKVNFAYVFLVESIFCSIFANINIKSRKERYYECDMMILLCFWL